MLFLARPGYNGGRHMEAVVVDSTANSIVVEDLTGDLETVQWSGEKAGLCGAAGASAPTNGAPLLITGATATTLTVAGDVETVRWTVEKAELCGAGSSGVASNGSQYIVYAAPFTDPVRGTWQTDVHKGGTRYLWAGYRYVPPMVGYYKPSNGTTVGAQAGNNKLGQYHCNNRVYSIGHGRWLSPDQAKSPSWNLFDYTRDSPGQRADPTGLETDAEIQCAINNPEAAIIGKAAATRAVELQKEVSPDTSGNGSEADAFRHCVWQCLFMSQYGAVQVGCLGGPNWDVNQLILEDTVKKVKEFGDAHENVPEAKQAKKEKDMDLHNNAIGRLIRKMIVKQGLKKPTGAPQEWLDDNGKLDCKTSCKKALEYGDLRVLKLGKADKLADEPFKSDGTGGPAESGGKGIGKQPANLK